jgi:hypothetical protein
MSAGPDKELPRWTKDVKRESGTEAINGFFMRVKLGYPHM